ncbi:unnamed protein product [Caenorhabditis brenneri]
MDQDMRIIALMDHDYCMPNPIKTELVEPKIEELDYIEMPPEDFIEQKIEEPDPRQLDYMKLKTTVYHEAPPKLELVEPKSEKLEQQQQSQEPVLFEPKLEEPDCDEDYPEYIKLEPVDDSNEHSAPKPKKTHNRTCRICSYLVAEDETTRVTQKSRLLILMTGLVVGNRTTLEDARYWMYENSSVFLICKAHIEEAVKAIFTFLNIRKLDEMTNRSDWNKQRLMKIVNNIGERHDFSVFANFLLAYVLRMESKDAYLGNLSSGLSERFQRRKCVACSQLQPAGRIIVLKSKSRKIFLVVGLMFIGKRTVEEAREWYQEPIFYICRTHVTEAVNSIFEVLNVKTVNEIETCSMENRETLMATVNLLEPNHKMDQDMRIIELMDHDYCLQNPIKTELVEPKIEELDYIEMPPEAFIKEPEPVLFEPKLEEPDCDEAYPEYIKLEPVDDSNEHSSPKPKKTQNRKCRICSCMVAEDETTNVTQKSRLLILMTGLVVGNRTTVEDARYWMYENSSVFLICKAHQEEAVKGILSFLNIRKLDEMTNRSTENTQRLMQIVRDMGRWHDFSAFVNFLLAFVLKMDSKEAYLGILGSAFQSWKCVTCSQLQPADRIIVFNTKPKKIFLLVGLMSIGKITLEEAQQWYDCPIFHICRTHVTEAVNSIFEVLNVKTVNEIKWCSMKNHHKMDQDMRIIALMDHDYCLPNPIKTELVEPKIEELDYIKMPSDGFIEAPEPVLFEPKLEEPDCDEDYPKYIKLEPVDDSNEHSAPKPKEPRNRVCRICFYAVAENETINVTQKSQLLILMTGLVVENRTALQDARYWMYENPPVFLICKAHQEEAVKGILSFLNIRKLDEMTNRSEAKTQRLMEIVRDMGRRLKFSAFVNSLLAFVLEMDSKDVYLGNLSSALRSWKCMACSQLQPDNKIIFCNMKTRKIFLIVGLVSIGKIKVEEAQLFYHSSIFPICRTHVTEAVNSIFDVLNVETVNGMKWSCTENRETLMSVVNLLVPSMSFSNFSANLKNFIRNN